MELLKRFDKWTDSYIRIIKNYETNPLYYLGEYYKVTIELADWEAKFYNINEEYMTESELMEIITEYSRIIKKLTNVDF